MDIYACGTPVIIKNLDVNGLITGISIRFSRVSYEISYFYNGDQKIIWMDEIEFNIREYEKKSIIGFKN